MLFSRKDLTRLIIPLIFEQFMAVSIGIVATLLVSRAGEAAVSGISLVESINTLLIQVFSALATGGAVVCSQYLGKNDLESARLSARQLYYSVFSVSLFIMLVTLLLRDQLIRWIFGTLDEDVFRAAQIFFTLSAISYPFLGIYNAGAAVFRAMGNTKVSLLVSLVMNIVNLAVGYLLIIVLRLDVLGAGFATLLARLSGALTISLFLLSTGNPIHIRGIFRFSIDWSIIKRILGIGIPSGVENGLFQVGKVLVTSLVSSFGTASIAAYAIANNVSNFVYVPSGSLGLAMITVVGRCMGAEDVKEARRYTLKLAAIAYAGITLTAALSYILDTQILSWYAMTDETNALALVMIHMYAIFSALFHVPSFCLPNALRAAGDVRFTMTVSILTMWLVRVSLSYILSLWLHMGVIGVWLAMCLEWIVRGIIFVTRFLGNRWHQHKVI
ncbi:MAG: MATE family efflux transporter [Clostridia bacterium]|nr:MATE family efflux transporter [Clostridia bacterium]